MKHIARILLLTLMAMNATLLKPASAQNDRIALNSGTKIRVELADDLSSNKSHKGDEVVYYVADDVRSEDGSLLIRKGAKAHGMVTEAKGAGTFGRKGKLSFTVERVRAVDDTEVDLRSTEAKSGKGRGTTVVAVAALVSVVGVFIKGKNISIPKGSKLDAYVDDDTRIAPVRSN